jgi:hypothetical protein
MTKLVSGAGDGDGRWPFRSWQFWCGGLAGVGLGLLLGAAFVEVEFLTLHSKAWCSVLGMGVVETPNFASFDELGNDHRLNHR